MALWMVQFNCEEVERHRCFWFQLFFSLAGGKAKSRAFFAFFLHDVLSLSVRFLFLVHFCSKSPQLCCRTKCYFPPLFLCTVNFRICNCFTGKRFVARSYFILFDAEKRWNRNWSADGNNDGAFGEQWIICHRKWLDSQHTRNIDATWKVFRQVLSTRMRRSFEICIDFSIRLNDKCWMVHEIQLKIIVKISLQLLIQLASSADLPISIRTLCYVLI